MMMIAENKLQKAGKIGVNGTFAEMSSGKIYTMGLALNLL